MLIFAHFHAESVRHLLAAGSDTPRLLPMLVPQAVRFCALNLQGCMSLPESDHHITTVELLVFLARLPNAPRPSPVPEAIASYMSRLSSAMPSIIDKLQMLAHDSPAWQLHTEGIWTCLVLARWLQYPLPVQPLLSSIQSLSTSTVSTRRRFEVHP